MLQRERRRSGAPSIQGSLSKQQRQQSSVSKQVVQLVAVAVASLLVAVGTTLYVQTLRSLNHQYTSNHGILPVNQNVRIKKDKAVLAERGEVLEKEAAAAVVELKMMREAGDKHHQVPREERRRDKEVLSKETLVIKLQDNHLGDLRLVLRPDLSKASVAYIREMVGKGCRTRCKLYRVEKPGILQGCVTMLLLANERRKEALVGLRDRLVFYVAHFTVNILLSNSILANANVPVRNIKGSCPAGFESVANDCPAHDPQCACHGPTMTHGMVGWAAGGTGPDFFINTYKKPAKWWGTQHTGMYRIVVCLYVWSERVRVAFRNSRARALGPVRPSSYFATPSHLLTLSFRSFSPSNRTVWAEIQDDASFATIDAIYKLPGKRQGGLTYLEEPIFFKVELENGGGTLVS